MGLDRIGQNRQNKNCYYGEKGISRLGYGSSSKIDQPRPTSVQQSNGTYYYSNTRYLTPSPSSSPYPSPCPSPEPR